MRFGRHAVWSAFVFAGSAQALTLAELKQELAQHPEAEWSAGETPAVAQFGGKAHAFGLPAAWLEARKGLETVLEFPTPEGAPTTFDWRNASGINWVSPVKNQGRCGSCVAFAATAAFESQFNVAIGRAGVDFDASEQDLFSRIGSCDSGSWPASATAALRSRGALDEACYPYVSGRLGEDAPTSGACADAAARAIKITGSQTFGPSQAKAALLNGPLMTTMTVYEDFMFYTGGVYRHVAGDYAGGHAVTIVGYDDEARAWIVKNSWGTDWGESGFFRIAYDDVSGVGSSNTAFTLSTPNTYLKLASPTHLSAVAGDLELRGVTTRDLALDGAPFSIVGKGTARSRHDGRLDTTSLSATVDTTALEDGVYEVKLASEVSGQTARPWYAVVAVANHPQNVVVTLAPDAFDPSRPIRDRVFFNIGATVDRVPLTSIDFVIEKADGAPVRTTMIEDPGTRAKIGWRTASYANGDYRVKAVGKIGALQAFSSGWTHLTVQN